jgi:hypothetical protein
VKGVVKGFLGGVKEVLEKKKKQIPKSILKLAGYKRVVDSEKLESDITELI